MEALSGIYSSFDPFFNDLIFLYSFVIHTNLHRLTRHQNYSCCGSTVYTSHHKVTRVFNSSIFGDCRYDLLQKKVPPLKQNSNFINILSERNSKRTFYLKEHRAVLLDPFFSQSIAHFYLTKAETHKKQLQLTTTEYKTLV